jgi:hypothetical protein
MTVVPQSSAIAEIRAVLHYMEIMCAICVCGITENREQESLFPTEQMFVTWLEGLQKACNLALEAKTWNVHTDSRK